MQNTNNYFKPEVEIIEVLQEGVLCGSNPIDMNPEEGNM